MSWSKVRAWLSKIFCQSSINGPEVDNAKKSPDLKSRVVLYRGGGDANDGISAVFSHKIDDLDFALMGADISCSKKHYPDIPDNQLIVGRWYAIDKNSELAKRGFYNSHGSSDDDGKSFYNETAFLGLPDVKYQASPEEVIWHKLRVDQLRAQGLPQDERLRILATERALSPWASNLTTQG